MKATQIMTALLFVINDFSPCTKSSLFSPALKLGRFLGPARRAGNEMCQWVLKNNGQVVARRSCWPLSPDELHSPVEQRKRDIFDVLIGEKFGDSINPPKKPMPARGISLGGKTTISQISLISLNMKMKMNQLRY